MRATPLRWTLPLIVIFVSGLAQVAYAFEPFVERFTQRTLAPDWILSGDARLTGGVEDPAGDGWLRLTQAQSNHTGVAYYNKPFPSTQGLVISFEYATWGGIGADGITIFLFDGEVGQPDGPPFRIGGWGGSLGYAQRCSSPGLSRGYLGVGIDEFGNFSNSNECRSGGVQHALVADAVSLRGPGDSAAAQDYPFLTGTGTLPVPIDCPRAQCARRPQTIGPGLKQMSIVLAPSAQGYQVSVWLRDDPAQDPVEIIPPYLLSLAPPSTLKLGYAASTGNSHNYHEVRNLRVALPVDLSVSAAAVGEWVAGRAVSYEVSLSNSPLNPAKQVRFEHQWPSSLSALSWTCKASGGASCPALQGSGDPSATLDMPPNSSLTWLISAQLERPAQASPSLSAQVIADSFATDINPTNNAVSLSAQLEPDADGDGLPDALELASGLSDPMLADSDGDGLCDGPLSVEPRCVAGEDLNADGVVDPLETSPQLADTDAGGLDDGAERLARGSDPLDPSDDLPAQQPAPSLVLIEAELDSWREPLYLPSLDMGADADDMVAVDLLDSAEDLALTDEALPPTATRVNVEYVGTGCQSAPAAPTSIFGALWLFAAGLLRRPTRRVSLWLGLMCVAFYAPELRAQSYTPSTQLGAQLDTLELRAQSLTPLSVDPQSATAHALLVGVTTQYIHRPLVRLDEAGEALDVIRLQVRTELSLAVAGGWWSAEAALPMMLAQRGTDFSSSAQLYQRLDGWGVADPRLSGILKLPSWSNRLALGVLGSIYLPVGDAQMMWSDGVSRQEVRVLAHWRPRANLGLTSNLGFQHRPARQSEGLSSSSFWRLSLSAQLDDVVGQLDAHLGAELQQRAALEHWRASTSRRVEALGGVRWPLRDGLSLDLNGALGVGRSPGTPAWRGILGVAFAYDQADEPTLACQWPQEDWDGFEDDDGCLDPDNDQDGFADLEDLCPTQPGSDQGCPAPQGAALTHALPDVERVDPRRLLPAPKPPRALDNGSCKLSQQVDCSTVAPIPSAPPRPQQVLIDGDKLVLSGRIFFETNEAIIQPRSYELLREVAQVIVAHEEQWVGVVVEGHTDDQGDAAANLLLSERRARQVALFLVEQGVNPSQLKAQGFGETRPLRHNETELGRALNRRVELRILHRTPSSPSTLAAADEP